MKVSIFQSQFYGSVHFADVRGECNTVLTKSEKHINHCGVDGWTDHENNTPVEDFADASNTACLVFLFVCLFVFSSANISSLSKQNQRTYLSAGLFVHRMHG